VENGIVSMEQKDEKGTNPFVVMRLKMLYYLLVTASAMNFAMGLST
jgi:hypothetical protein